MPYKKLCYTPTGQLVHTPLSARNPYTKCGHIIDNHNAPQFEMRKHAKTITPIHSDGHYCKICFEK